MTWIGERERVFFCFFVFCFFFLGGGGGGGVRVNEKKLSTYLSQNNLNYMGKIPGKRYIKKKHQKKNKKKNNKTNMSKNHTVYTFQTSISLHVNIPVINEGRHIIAVNGFCTL